MNARFFLFITTAMAIFFCEGNKKKYRKRKELTQFLQQRRSKFISRAPLVLEKNAVVATYSGGRFGDNILAIAHTLYFSLKNNCTMFLIPFPYSEQLMLSELLPTYTSTIRECFHRRIVFPGGNVLADKSIKDALFVIPYFTESPIEYTVQEWPSFEVEWNNRTFKQKLNQLIAPKAKLSLITPPPHKISVAVHIRKGGGFDNFNSNEGIIVYKAPHDAYYINQIKKVAEIFSEIPLYVFLFTDDPHPESLAHLYQEALNNPLIEFAYRTENSHQSNVLEDFFSMMKNFEVLIRPESNFSIMAEKCGEHTLVISPGHFILGSRVQEGVIRYNVTKTQPGL